jgi:predicted N-acyltransferase
MTALETIVTPPKRTPRLALAKAEQTYSFVARRFDEFDDYLRSVRARFRAAGYRSCAGLGRG